MEQTIIITDTFSEIFQKVKSMPYPLAKFYNSKGQLHTSGYKEYIHETDERITSAYSGIKINFTTKGLYSKITGTDGITYNKKTKKLTLWGKGKMSEKFGYFTKLLDYLHIDWFCKMKKYPTYSKLPIEKMLTKTLAEQIIKGKVNNPEEFIKAYTRISLHHSEIPWKLIRDYYNTQIYFHHTNLTLKNILEYTTNPISALVKLNSDTLSRDYLSIFSDALMQCFILDKKISPSWSFKRLCSEHEAMSEEITEMDLATKDATPIKTDGELLLLNGMTLIKSEIEAFKEATFMHNCIYSNYWRHIKNRNYFVVKYVKDGMHYDIGIYPLHSADHIYLYGKKVENHSVIDQIRAIRNTQPPKEIIDEIEVWFNTPQVLAFFDAQKSSNNTKEDKLEDYLWHALNHEVQEEEVVQLPF